MKQHHKVSITHPYNTYSILIKIFDIFLISLVLLVILNLNNLKWIDQYTWWLLITMITFQSVVDLKQLQRSQRMTLQITEIFSIVIPWGMSLVLLVSINQIICIIPTQTKKYFWIWSILTPIILLGWHIVLSKIFAFTQKIRNVRRIAIVGVTELGICLQDIILEKKFIQDNVVGFFDDISDKEKFSNLGNIKFCGNLQKLVEEITSGYIDDVYITLPLASESKIKMLIEQLSNTTASVYYIPNLFVFDLLRPTLYNIDGLPVISIYDSPFTKCIESFMKRLFDIIISCIMLIMMLIPLIVISLAIKITSHGPIIFKQRRYGLDGKTIVIWKFRTMTVCEDGEIINQATKNDVRVTRLGGFLRKSSLDELPQFINVLQGSMSVVGPRPHAVTHNDLYRTQIKGYMLRHKVKPGITGLAQIEGYRGETDTLDKMKNRVRYDLLYIQNWSLWLDIKIILLTPYAVLTSFNAY